MYFTQQHGDNFTWEILPALRSSAGRREKRGVAWSGIQGAWQDHPLWMIVGAPNLKKNMRGC